MPISGRLIQSTVPPADLIASGILGVDLLERRPARMRVDIISEHRQHRNLFELWRIRDHARRRRLDGDNRLELVGPLLRDLERKRRALAVRQHNARTDLVDQRDIRRDDWCISRQPARH